MALKLAPLFMAVTAAAAHAQSLTTNFGTLDKLLMMVGPAQSTEFSQKTRFDVYVLGTVGPVPLIGEALGAGVSQWADTPHEWGQGWNAYGRRYGSNLAYNAVRQTIAYGVSIPFREDNRYFGSRADGILPRAGYAVLSTFTARHPDGSRQFSVSGVVSVLGAAGISSVWGPRSWKGAGNIAENAGISFAATAGLNVVREFLPDLFHRPRK